MVYFLLRGSFFYFLAFLVVGGVSAITDTSLSSEASSAVPGAPEYTIGIEDTLSIFVWKEEDLNRKVLVRPDGKISFPLVDDVMAAGLTCRELADSIREKLLSYIKEPHVTVIVEEINSFKVYVLGEVNRQGVFTLKSPAKVLQAIAMAEGLSEFAKKSDIMIIRKDADREKIIRIDYGKIVSGEKPDDNIYLKPYDTIIVN